MAKSSSPSKTSRNVGSWSGSVPKKTSDSLYPNNHFWANARSSVGWRDMLCSTASLQRDANRAPAAAL
eukprot:13432109-Alexandrium_andersonii.AAC.1